MLTREPELLSDLTREEVEKWVPECKGVHRKTLPYREGCLRVYTELVAKVLKVEGVPELVAQFVVE